MSELKTLKDLWGMKDDKRKPRHLIINDFKEELKQEAIKGVKEGMTLQEFANITESDLKELKGGKK